jgi:adenylate cyclase
VYSDRASRLTSSTESRRTIPLLFALLLVLVPLVLSVTGAIIWQGFAKSRQSAIDAGQQLFQNLQTEIAVQQQGLFEPMRLMVTAFAADPEFGDGAQDRYFKPFVLALELYPHIASIRVGYGTGELFEVSSLREGVPMSANLAAIPESAVYVIHSVERSAINRQTADALAESWRFYDKDQVEIGRLDVAKPDQKTQNYPWYTQAIASPGKLIETQPYISSALSRPGLSVAQSFQGTTAGVLAADITLERISTTVSGLATDGNEQLFLFYGDGPLIAHPDFENLIGKGPWNPDVALNLPDIGTLTSPVAQAMVKEYRRSGEFGLKTLDVQGLPFLATVISLGGSPVRMALALPQSNFTAGLETIGRDGALISLLILALSIPLIVVIARRFSRPLAALAAIADRIAQFDLREPESKPSMIAEIAQLSASMARMRSAFAQVAKFVPKSLVQDLVRSGARTEVGGERRTISVLMTDVKDFTTIAESMSAEELMAQMSEYFEVVVGVVLQNGGTVDKFVGDAVFAFWNAPLQQVGHEAMACRAALQARKASNALNAHWQAGGQHDWFTRFGVHVGDAVIGNVGSSDRLDYTAIGDTVNMGSRLEGLNKVYGTQILLSGAAKAIVEDSFLCRPVDLVLPKGAIHPIEIFELVCERGEATDGDLQRCAAWAEVMTQYRGQAWVNAQALLASFLQHFPTDGPAQALLKRVTRFSAESPQNWDGVTRFDSK